MRQRTNPPGIAFDDLPKIEAKMRELVAKDLDYVASAVAAGRNRAPLSAATRLAMGEAIAKGFGNDNLTGVVRIYN